MKPSVRRWVIGIGVLDVILFIALIVLLATRGPGTAGSSEAVDSPTTSATTATSALPPPEEGEPTDSGTAEETAPAETPVQRETPEGALTVADFTLPSRNISCSLTEAGATCWIAQATFTPPPGDGCQWRGQVVTLDASGVHMPCPAEQPVAGEDGVTVLEYGQSTVVGPWLCTSSDRGLECSSLDDGTGFTLARASFNSYGPGRLV